MVSFIYLLNNFTFFKDFLRELQTRITPLENNIEIALEITGRTVELGEPHQIKREVNACILDRCIVW